MRNNISIPDHMKVLMPSVALHSTSLSLRNAFNVIYYKKAYFFIINKTWTAVIISQPEVEITTVDSGTVDGAVATVDIYKLLARWRNLKSQKRRLARFCSKNRLKNSVGEKEQQVTVRKVVI